jgi:hypothetical protein
VRHVGCRPGFVDEDEAVRVKIKLAVEPALALSQDVGALLLDGVCSLFLRVKLRRAKSRCKVDTATTTPSLASAWRSSSSVASRCAS